MRNGLLDQETEERLLAYFNGELDEEGRFAVEQWLNDSPENKKVYHQLEKDALFIRWANREQKVHVEDREAMLFRQIRRAKIRKIGFRVAASVAVLVALGGVYLFMSTPAKENMLAENTPIIRANYPQARLVLSTGEVIDLTKNTDNIVERMVPWWRSTRIRHSCIINRETWKPRNRYITRLSFLVGGSSS